MIDRVRFFYNRINKTEQIKVFNIVNIICIIGMIFICFIIGLFIDDPRALYISFAFCVLFFLTLIEGNRTGKTINAAHFMALGFNLIYMPIVFLMFGRFICVIPIYFLFGIVYTGLLINIRMSLIISFIELIEYLIILCLSYNKFDIVVDNISISEANLRYYSAVVGVVLTGTVAGGAVRYRYLSFLRAQENERQIKEEAMEAYVAKDMFMVNMSHDIRTPMNAIVGAANLMLDQNINETVADSLYSILNSCNALLSITDELMDISKSDRGEVEIYSSTYDISELLLEIINMMTVRLTESNLDFFIEINNNIPKFLYGDYSKIRQVLVNLLNNSFKHTTEGKIILRVDYAQIDSDRLELIFDVEDTGEGIRREDIGGIFDVKSEEDESESNISTGISLNICRSIINKMSGQIDVESQYLVGSIFTVRIPQKYSNNNPIATVYANVEYRILIFEQNEEYSEYIKRILDSFEINCDIAKNEQDFERQISINKYSHVFIANENSDLCSGFLNRRLNSENIVAIQNIDDSLAIEKASIILNRPASALTIASLLKNEMGTYVRDVMKKGKFTCPKATILVVDDNFTNLNIARAILEKYEAKVITASSGREGINVLKDNDVNLVFLDYMMPEMNGIDTLQYIRKMPGSKYASLPVVSLTANVISGAREMFLDAGFDDFMSKPIVIGKLEKVLKKFLPKEFIEYVESNN